MTIYAKSKNESSNLDLLVESQIYIYIYSSIDVCGRMVHLIHCAANILIQSN